MLTGGALKARGGAPAKTRRMKRCRQRKSTTPKITGKSSSPKTPSVRALTSSLLELTAVLKGD